MVWGVGAGGLGTHVVVCVGAGVLADVLYPDSAS